MSLSIAYTYGDNVRHMFEQVQVAHNREDTEFKRGWDAGYAGFVTVNFDSILIGVEAWATDEQLLEFADALLGQGVIRDTLAPESVEAIVTWVMSNAKYAPKLSAIVSETYACMTLAG